MMQASGDRQVAKEDNTDNGKSVDEVKHDKNDGDKKGNSGNGEKKTKTSSLLVLFKEKLFASLNFDFVLVAKQDNGNGGSKNTGGGPDNGNPGNGNSGNDGNNGNNGNGNDGNSGGNSGNGGNGNNNTDNGSNGNNENGGNSGNGSDGDSGGNNGNGNNGNSGGNSSNGNNGNGNEDNKDKYDNGKGNHKKQEQEDILLQELIEGSYKFAIPEIMETEPQYLINPQSRVTYTYDAAGNRLSMENDEGREEYVYNAANQLLQAGDILYEYDKRGNLITEKRSKGTKEYTYDGRNQLREVAYSDGTYAKYGYDGLGRMVYREEANYDLNKINELQQSIEVGANMQSGAGKTNNGNGNAGGNGYGKYNNPGQGNKYGIYKHDNQEIKIEPTDIEKTRYLYLGQSDTLHKEYSPQGSPYAEYYQANGQVISQKMFGLHGQITPGKEETLKTNGGLMYYQYDGTRNVTGLTNRHGEELERYRYDAFGNIYTGITAPYNTVGYTGQEYDKKSGLINMSARWYNSNSGRFITEDTSKGDIYNPQSLNQYAYVLNNPVNMWDPTGHVPDWVGRSYYLIPMPGDKYVDDIYYFKRSYSSASDWQLIDKITNISEIIYKYKATIERTWEYRLDDYSYNTLKDPETGENVYEFKSLVTSDVTYRQTDYYYKDVVKRASEIAQGNEQYIKNLAGDPPKSSDPPMVSISTRQVGNGLVEVLEPNDIILRNTGRKPSTTQKLIAGAVQSELNSILDSALEVDGWYGRYTAGATRDFQKALSLPNTDILDAKTFYQLETVYESSRQGTGNNAYQRTGYHPAGGHDPDDPRYANRGTGNDKKWYEEAWDWTKNAAETVASYGGDFGRGVGMAGSNAISYGYTDQYDSQIYRSNEIAYLLGKLVGDLGIMIVGGETAIASGGAAVATSPTIVGAAVFGAAAVYAGTVSISGAKNTFTDSVKLADAIKGGSNTPAPVNPKKVDTDYLKRNGIDPHSIKKDTLGSDAEISKYNTFVDKNGDVWLQKNGSKEFIPTYENIGR